jgi:hypothetical protein
MAEHVVIVVLQQVRSDLLVLPDRYRGFLAEVRRAHVTTTQQIYTHVDEVARRDALTKLNKLLGGTES